MIVKSILLFFFVLSLKFFFGGLAQLARAPALHAGGQRFDSVILHHTKFFDILELIEVVKK